MVILSKKVIADDRRLVSEGERVVGDLAALRYHWCVEEGTRQRDYAEAVGVTPGAIAQSIRVHRELHPHLAEAPKQDDKPAGKAGRNSNQQAAKKREAKKRPTREQVESRQRWTLKLYNQGYTRDTICRALGTGSGTVNGDLSAMGQPSGGRRFGLKTDADPVDWRSGPPRNMSEPKRYIPPIEEVPESERYKRSSVMRDIDWMLAAFDDRHIDAVFAVNYADAEAVGDVEWMQEVEERVRRLHEMTGYLVLIVEDIEYRRQRQSGTSQREPRQRTGLRAV